MSQSREKLARGSLIKLQTHSSDFNSTPIRQQLHALYCDSSSSIGGLNLNKQKAVCPSVLALQKNQSQYIPEIPCIKNAS